MSSSPIFDLPRALGGPLFTAYFKQQPSDFIVREQLDIELSGQGEHLYLLIEKQAMNTDEVTSMLQSCFGVSDVDVGVCGLKDRHAVTSQWFSVRTGLCAESFAPFADDYLMRQRHEVEDGVHDEPEQAKRIAVLNSKRHHRKLKRGAHAGNDFLITLLLSDKSSFDTADRGEAICADGCAGCLTHIEGLKARLDKRLSLIERDGFPNYIGPQRFGRGGQNLTRARQWFARPRKRTSRQQRSIWLSAARSAVFNHVCATRVAGGTWNQLLPGEPVILDGSRSFFVPDASAESGHEGKPGTTAQGYSAISPNAALTLQQRLQSFDIHPSAPWWGRGRTLAQGRCADEESAAMSQCLDLCAGLEQAGLTQERRSIRARATNVQHRWLNDTTLEMEFSLTAGTFATSLLQTLCDVIEPDRSRVKDEPVSSAL